MSKQTTPSTPSTTTTYIPPPSHILSTTHLSTQIRQFHDTRTPFRINHNSTNSTRARSASTPQLHIGHLNAILHIDAKEKFAWVEPNVALDTLVQETVRECGLMPKVVMEFPGITVGGGFSGASGESTCWREGLFDCCVEEVEMILGDGEVVFAKAGAAGGDDDDGRNAELFDAARCSLGTMGVVTLLKVKLVEAPGAVMLRYRHVSSFGEMKEGLVGLCCGDGKKKNKTDDDEEKYDFVEGFMYSRDSGVIVTGRHVNPTSATVAELPRVRFDRAQDPWFYLHAKETPNLHADLAPIQTYLFRHDRGAFWSGESVLNYWRVPHNRFTRWLFNPMMTARAIYKAMLAADSGDSAIVQDLLVPVDTCEDFFNYVADELEIWPLWLCPVRKRAEDKDRNVVAHPFYKDTGDMTINFGVWGPLPVEEMNNKSIRRINRRMEEKLVEVRGLKVPYAANHYTESEFWNLCYDRNEYERLRKKWRAEALPSIYDKVARHHNESEDDDGIGHDWPLWLKILFNIWPFANLWPLGGLFQMYVVLFK